MRDVLIGGGSILALGSQLSLAGLADATSRDLEGRYLVPGLIDGHQHTVGGGGGDGYESRLPEIGLAELVSAGLTTVVGMPGLETLTKPLEGRLAKAFALEKSGLSAYIMSGGFLKPFETLTGSLVRDIYLLEKIVGIKIALGEDRASVLETRELAELARISAWLRRATGRGVMLHFHLGYVEEPAAQVLDMLTFPGVNPEVVQVTHCNHSAEAISAGVELARRRCRIDLTGFFDGNYGMSESAVDGVMSLLEAGVPDDLITVSSDANGTVPAELEGGGYDRYEKNLGTVLETVRQLVRSNGLGLDRALRFVASNPADALGLTAKKGRLQPGLDADMIVLDDQLTVEDVYAHGRLLMKSKNRCTWSPFESGVATSA
ncbi:MAG: amidohydrolase family protein [Streptosporangiaceae bacterium]